METHCDHHFSLDEFDTVCVNRHEDHVNIFKYGYAAYDGFCVSFRPEHLPKILELVRELEAVKEQALHATAEQCVE